MHKATEDRLNRIQVTALGYGPEALLQLEEHFHRLGLDEAGVGDLVLASEAEIDSAADVAGCQGLPGAVLAVDVEVASRERGLGIHPTVVVPPVVVRDLGQPVVRDLRVREVSE